MDRGVLQFADGFSREHLKQPKRSVRRPGCYERPGPVVGTQPVEVGAPLGLIRVGVPPKDPPQEEAELEEGGDQGVGPQRRIWREESPDVAQRASVAASGEV